MAAPALIAGARNAIAAAAKDPNIRKGAQELAARVLGKEQAVAAFANPSAPLAPRVANVVMQAAARAGVPAGDILRGIDISRADAATARVMASLATAHEQNQQVLDSRFAIAGKRDYTQRRLDTENARWAIRHFGSRQAAITAHAQLRAFLAVDSDELHEYLNQAI